MTVLEEGISKKQNIPRYFARSSKADFFLSL